MGAFAAIRLPLDLSRRSGSAAIATNVIARFPGTQNVALDADSGSATFEMQFPGNLSELVARLRSSLIFPGDRADVSVPVKNLLAPDGPDAATFEHRLLEGPEVWDAEFDRGEFVESPRLVGDRVEASIVPRSSAMHQLYDALLSLALVAADADAVLDRV
jgi:hypothetical protein